MRHAKCARFIMLALASFACGAHAIKLCQLDWFAAWQNKSGTLSNSRHTATSNYGSQAESGSWTVTSDEGSPGAQHTVGGISQCTADTGTTSTAENPGPSGTLANNTKCWCRMTSPHLGASWVFYNATYISEAAAAVGCARDCADNCAGCVQNGGGVFNTCSRSKVLALQ